MKVLTLGYLDRLKLSGNVLKIYGWAASSGNGPVTNFEVFISGERISDIQANRSLKSPDVKAVYPDLDFAENCRFDLTIPLDLTIAKLIDKSLILVCPIFEEIRGSMLCGKTETNTLTLPSKEDTDAMGGGFLNVAMEFFNYLLDYTKLQQSSHILDVGCGIGRIAYPLTTFLSKNGLYEGFDIHDRGINFAKNNISTIYPNFNFVKVDIYNEFYNSEGRIAATDFNFPYQKNSFDLVFLTSVFTHMYPDHVKHYLNEIYKMLHKGGYCLLTCFLLNTESIRLIKEEKSSQMLTHKRNDFYTVDENMPETTIGFDEDIFIEWISNRGFTLESKLYGKWCGREKFNSYQDILVLRK